MSRWRFNIADRLERVVAAEERAHSKYRADQVNRAIVHGRFDLAAASERLQAACDFLEKIRASLSWISLLLSVITLRLLFPNWHVWEWLANL